MREAPRRFNDGALFFLQRSFWRLMPINGRAVLFGFGFVLLDSLTDGFLLALIARLFSAVVEDAVNHIVVALQAHFRCAQMVVGGDEITALALPLFCFHVWLPSSRIRV